MKTNGLVWTAIGVALVVLAWLQVPSGEAQQPWCPSKYGPADVLGAINEITPEKVLQAVKLVKTGKVYDMGVLLELLDAADRPRGALRAAGQESAGLDRGGRVRDVSDRHPA
jgi:hypothetical protein